MGLISPSLHMSGNLPTLSYKLKSFRRADLSLVSVCLNIVLRKSMGFFYILGYSVFQSLMIVSNLFQISLVFGSGNFLELTIYVEVIDTVVYLYSG